jgi:hypothetical protein
MRQDTRDWDVAYTAFRRACMNLARQLAIDAAEEQAGQVFLDTTNQLMSLVVDMRKAWIDQKAKK